MIFKNKTKKKYLPLYILMLIAGAIMFLFGLLGANSNKSLRAGFCFGFGLVIFIASVSKVVHCLTMSDKEQKEIDIEINDERNIAIREKASYYTIAIIIPLMAIGALVFVFTNNIIGALVIAAILFTYAICIIWFARYFSKRL